VSDLAAVLRFVEVGTYPLMVEYFRLGESAKYTNVQIIAADDWFHYASVEATLHEQCFYSDYGYVISLIWPN
jgi:hypothetical protein